MNEHRKVQLLTQRHVIKCDLFFPSSSDNLLFVINSIKQEIVNRVQIPKDDRGTNMEQKLDVLVKDTLGKE